MVERSRIKLLTGALASVLLPGLSGCAWPPYEGPPSRVYPPYYYDYYYYPNWGVYFHIYTGWYYYHDHRRWRRVRRLPPHIRLDRRRRRLLRIPEGKPWLRHEEHRRKYPPQPRPRRPRQKPVPQRPREKPVPQRPRPEPVPQRPRQKPVPQRPRQKPVPQRPRPEPVPQRPKPPPPNYHRERDRDRLEREHNIRRYKEYRTKPWPPPEE